MSRGYNDTQHVVKAQIWDKWFKWKYSNWKTSILLDCCINMYIVYKSHILNGEIILPAVPDIMHALGGIWSISLTINTCQTSKHVCEGWNVYASYQHDGYPWVHLRLAMTKHHLHETRDMNLDATKNSTTQMNFASLTWLIWYSSFLSAPLCHMCPQVSQVIISKSSSTSSSSCMISTSPVLLDANYGCSYWPWSVILDQPGPLSSSITIILSPIVAYNTL